MRTAFKISALLAIVLALSYLGSIALSLRETRPEQASPEGQSESGVTPKREPTSVRDAIDARRPVRGQVHESPPIQAKTLLRVRVTAIMNNKPLEGVEVGVSQSREEAITLIAHGLTGSQGIVEFVVESNVELKVTATSSEGLQAAANVTALVEGEVREVNLSIPAAFDRKVSVRVFDRETQQPIAGALIGPDGDPSRAHLVGTDAAGIAHIRLPSRPVPVLVVAAEGYEPAALQPEGHQNASEIEVPLSKVATLRVRVLRRDGTPVQTGAVEATTNAYHFGRPFGSVTTKVDPVWRENLNADGRAELGLPPLVPLRMGVFDGEVVLWRQEEPVVLDPGEVRELIWTVGTGAQVHGLVVEQNGSPAPDIEVWLLLAMHTGEIYLDPRWRESGTQVFLRRRRSDATGQFLFDDIDTGSWWVGPAPDDRRDSKGARTEAIAPLAQVVQVTADARAVDVVVRLQRGLDIEGLVLDPDGKPLDAYVWAHPVLEGALGFANTSPDGRFVLGPLGQGEYRLIAGSVGSLHAESDPVLAAIGENDVILRLRPGASLSGVVKDSETQTPCAANIRLVRHEPASLPYLLATSEADGRYMFKALTAGTYSVSADTDGGNIGSLRNIELRVGESLENLVVEVRAGARVRVEFQGPSPYGRIDVRQDGVIVNVENIQRQLVRMIVVPAGKVQLRMSTPETHLPSDMEIVLRIGETREVLFDGGWR